MRQIRKHVFETNSSSCHSLGLASGCNEHDISSLERYVEIDGYLHMEFGEFGWEEDRYNDAYTKLQYILTFIAMKTPDVCIWCCSHPMDMDDINEKLKSSSDFIELNAIIEDELHCNGIWMDDGEGYIDHQSHENYATVEDLLSDYGISSARDFIFNNNYYLETDNDNHY